MSTPVVFASCPPALLSRYAGQIDPVPDLRRAVREAAGWLREQASAVEIVGETRVAEEILADHPRGQSGLWITCNGSARRTEKAPGHLDERAADFDAEVLAALESGDVDRLVGLDLTLADELLASGLEGVVEVAKRGRPARSELRYADDPFGVQYWVVTWQLP